MGLQFIDRNGSERTLTEADMLLPEFQETFWDLYKSLHGIRPRGMLQDTRYMLMFFDTYEECMKEQNEEDARSLAVLSEKDGVQYTSWNHYYEMEDARRERECEVEAEKQRAIEEAKAEYNRRGSPAPIIEAWEFGEI